MSKRKFNRRAFLGGAGALAGATVLGRGRTRAAPGTRAPSPVFSAFHQNLVTGTTPDTVDEVWVRAAVDACIKAMTGAATAAQAWEAIFPGIDASKKIAIKVNCLNDNVYPQFATIKAMVEGMTEMLGGTYPAGNISLFDNNLWRSGKVDACYGASKLDSLGIEHGEDTYASGTTVSIGGTTMYISKYWAEASYGISLAKMAPHQYYAGGLSGVIKNMMGALSLNNNATFEAKRSNGGFHDEAPYTAWRDFFTGYAAGHLHLYVVDMLFACRHENESGWAKVVKRITMGTDPVAVDSYNVDKINELGMNVVIPVTKAVPLALEEAGVGSTDYDLQEPQVSIEPQVPTRDELDARIKARRDGTASDAEVQGDIKRYREQ